jgi:hypothetical protein
LKTETITSKVRLKILSSIGNSLLAGFWGYLLFLTILFFTKIIARFVQDERAFTFEVEDFILPIIGFVLMFLIRFLENFKEN